MSSCFYYSEIILIQNNKSGLLSMCYQLKVRIDDASFVIKPYRLMGSWELTIKRLMKRFGRDNVKNVVLYCESFTPVAKRIYQLLHNYFQMNTHVTTSLTNQEKYWVEQINENTKDTEDAFLNGFKIFLSGLYPTYMTYDGIKHIYVNSTYPDEIVDWNINSSIITKKDSYPAAALPYHLEHITIEYTSKNVLLVSTAFSEYVLKIYNLSDAEKARDDSSDIACVIIETKEDIALFNRLMSFVTRKGQIPLYFGKFIIMDEFTLFNNAYNPSENRITGGFMNDIGRTSRAGEAEKADSYIIQVRNAIKPFYQQYAADGKHVMVTFPAAAKQQWFHPEEDFDTEKFTQKEYVVFQIKDEYFIFSEYTNTYFEINLVIAKALEIFLYCNNHIDFHDALLRYGFNDRSTIKISTLLKEKFKIR